MKIAASNIAWAPDEDDLAAEVLRGAGVEGIEVAPTVVWPSPLEVTEREALEFRDTWERRGFEIVAFQSLLYGRPELQVFGAPSVRAQTIDYLGGICRLAGWLGARGLVFGSPRNRHASHLSDRERARIAEDFFLAVADRAAATGTVLCLEPNPPEYDCDWMRTVEEVAGFVSGLGHPGLGLQLDGGQITLGGESPAALAAAVASPGATHVHASDPFLALIGSTAEGARTHALLSGVLRDRGYAGWVSLEMARRGEVDRRAELTVAASRLAEWYREV